MSLSLLINVKFMLCIFILSQMLTEEIYMLKHKVTLLTQTFTADPERLLSSFTYSTSSLEATILLF